MSSIFSKQWHQHREYRLMMFLANLEREGATLKESSITRKKDKYLLAPKPAITKYSAKCDSCGKLHVKHHVKHRYCRTCEAYKLMENNNGC